MNSTGLLLKNRVISKLAIAGAAALMTLSGLNLPVQAQDAPQLPGTVVVGDLNAPRGVAFDAAGNLLVAVAGSGGEAEVSVPSTEGDGTMQTFKTGLSGQVLSVAADGTAKPLIAGLPSYAGETETIGVYRAIPHGDSLWIVTSSAMPGMFWADSIVELDAKTLRVKTFISPADYEETKNPDTNEIDSNVTDIAWTADGTMLITDAGGNTLYSWTKEAGLAVVASWPDNSVPTSVEVAANGDIYVGFLGAGLAPGAGKIERWADGKLAETFAGLNAVSDILLDGDTLYAVQLVLFTEQGPGPGSVIKVDASGATPIAEGIPAPFAIAKGPDGALYVSYGTIAFAPGMTGGVLKLEAK